MKRVQADFAKAEDQNADMQLWSESIGHQQAQLERKRGKVWANLVLVHFVSHMLTAPCLASQLLRNTRNVHSTSDTTLN